MSRQYRVFPDPQTLAQQFAVLFAERVFRQLQTKQNLCIALSGGGTPQLWFAETVKNFADKIDYQRLHFFWVDERYVPHDHSESNYGIAQKLLFDNIDIPSGNIHPIPVTGVPETDVRSYTAEIKKYVPIENDRPVFDIVTLGMGTDGHTASIFPGQLNLFDCPDFVAVSENPHTRQRRITLTGPVINASEAVYFLATGADKAPLIRDIFAERAIAETYPAAHIRKRNTEWLIDRKAATFIDNK